jgi:hypothetical protein
VLADSEGITAGAVLAVSTPGWAAGLGVGGDVTAGALVAAAALAEPGCAADPWVGARAKNQRLSAVAVTTSDPPNARRLRRLVVGSPIHVATVSPVGEAASVMPGLTTGAVSISSR